MVRAELGQLKETPVLVIWQYAKGGEKKVACLVRTGRLRGWQISKAYHDHRPAPLKEAQPSGLMPYDSAFMFDAQDCIRTKDTAYTPDGGLAILYGQLAPEGSVVKTAGISDEFKKYCGAGFRLRRALRDLREPGGGLRRHPRRQGQGGRRGRHPQRRAARRAGHAGNALAHQLHRRAWVWATRSR